MSIEASPLIDPLLALGSLAVFVNEVRGLLVAGPMLHHLYHSGGTWMGIFLAACGIGGLALSVLVPALLVKVGCNRRVKPRQLVFANWP